MGHLQQLQLRMRSSSVPRQLRRWNSAPALILATISIWLMYGISNALFKLPCFEWATKSKAPTVNLVLASTQNSDIAWASKLNITNLNIIPYVADNDTATYHPRQNKGREAMIILTYLHDFYDDLPDITIFTHAADFAWHNDVVMKSSLTWMLSNLDLNEVLRRKYLSLRIDWENACPSWINMSMTVDSPQYNGLKREEPFMAKAFEQHFPNDTMPEIMAAPCCSQFAVTREAIQRVSKSEYANYIFYLLNTELEDDLSGRIWEHWWQYLFLKKAADCPVEYKALCAGFHVCFEHQWEFEDYNVLVRMKGDRDRERNEVRDQVAFDKHKFDELSWKIRDVEKDMALRWNQAAENGKHAKKRKEIIGDDF